MLVGWINKFHHPFMGGDHKIPDVQYGGITKFTLNEIHNIDFYKAWKKNRGYASFLAMLLQSLTIQ